MDSLSRERILKALENARAGAFGATVHYYPQIDSTNEMLRRLAEEGAPEGTLVIADEQIAGRGRMGRTWLAPAGSSLLMSVLFRPLLAPADAHRLVMIVGLSVAEACEALAGIHIDIKWPNDLQIGGRKVAGILPESAIIGDRLAWVIVGLGFNVNQGFSPDDPLAFSATSLRVASGRALDRADLLAAILGRLNSWYARVGDPAPVDAWRARCVTLGQRISIAGPAGTLSGLAEAIDPSGALWLRTDDGQRHCLTWGEATVLTR